VGGGGGGGGSGMFSVGGVGGRTYIVVVRVVMCGSGVSVLSPGRVSCCDRELLKVTSPQAALWIQLPLCARPLSKRGNLGRLSLESNYSSS